MKFSSYAFLFTTILLLIVSPIYAQQKNIKTSAEPLPLSLVDVNGFIITTNEAVEHRKTRLLSLNEFIKAQQQPGVIVLDTRSKTQFNRKHIKGSVHLNFSDFTKEELAKIIPSKNTKILIYCNNNIQGDAKVFPTKSFSLALNIPTFINLYGYGYKNIYELKDLVDIISPELMLEGSEVEAIL